MAQLTSIKAAKFCGLLQNELSSYTRDVRGQILYNTMNWILTQANADPKAHGAYAWFQELYQVSQHSGSTREFLQHYVWSTFVNHWESPSFKAAIASILDNSVYSDEDSESEEEEEEETETEDSDDESEEEEEVVSRRRR